MNRSLGLLARSTLILVVLAAALFGAGAARTAASSTGSISVSPTLTVLSTPTPGRILVNGASFTPGGRVRIRFYDDWSTFSYEDRWVTASRTVYDRDGGLDPARGFYRGGTLREAFIQPCGLKVGIRAFDESTEVWSNWVNLVPQSGSTSAAQSPGYAYDFPKLDTCRGGEEVSRPSGPGPH